MRGAGKGESEGAGAWTCARATAWNSQHWLREGAWWIEGVSHRPSAQRRARKLAERTVIAIVYEWNDSLQSHACSCVATRRNAMWRTPRRSDHTSGNIDGATMTKGFRFHGGSRPRSPPAVSVISSKMAGIRHEYHWRRQPRWFRFEDNRGGSRIASVLTGRQRPTTRFRRTSWSRTFAEWSVSCFVRSTVSVPVFPSGYFFLFTTLALLYMCISSF